MKGLSVFILFYCLGLRLAAMDSFFQGYRDTPEFNSSLKDLRHPYLKIKVLATTLGGNDILLLSLNKGKTKPALLIVGDTKADIPVGSEILYHWLKKLTAKENADKLNALLEKNTLEGFLTHQNQIQSKLTSYWRH